MNCCEANNLTFLLPKPHLLLRML